MIISVFSVFIPTKPPRWRVLSIAKQPQKLIRQKDQGELLAARQLVDHQSDLGLVVSSLMVLQASLTQIIYITVCTPVTHG